MANHNLHALSFLFPVLRHVYSDVSLCVPEGEPNHDFLHFQQGIYAISVSEAASHMHFRI